MLLRTVYELNDAELPRRYMRTTWYVSFPRTIIKLGLTSYLKYALFPVVVLPPLLDSPRHLSVPAGGPVAAGMNMLTYPVVLYRSLMCWAKAVL